MNFCPNCFGSLTGGLNRCECKPTDPPCELCGKPVNQWTQGELKGLCRACSTGLGGGPYSATAVKEEAAKRRGSCLIELLAAIAGGLAIAWGLVLVAGWLA